MSDIPLKNHKLGSKCPKCGKDLYHHLEYYDEDCYLVCKTQNCECHKADYNDTTYLGVED